MKKNVIVLWIMGSLVASGSADVFLEDLFDDGNLATSLQLNGGFYEVDNGLSKDGFSGETNGNARLVNGTQKNITGLISSNRVDLSSGSITRWDIRDYEISNVSSYIAVTWQTSTDYTMYPELSIIADLEGNGITFLADGTNTLGHQDLTLGFDDHSGFSLLSTFDSDGYTIAGFGIQLNGETTQTNIVFSGNWSGSQKTYIDLFKDSYSIGVFVNGQNNGAASFNIEAVSVEPIPEPAVIGLIGIFGGGIILSHRIFGQKNKGFDT
ncbi:MAG: hypothetical protein DRP64_10700 [Verrucomicrobia bacterium]|nr:MAG: hypothetical protein DRP64_10700 [Verrucomicrobiota bacterium]